MTKHLTLEEYREKVKISVCRWDNTKLPDTVRHYDHDDGWDVQGFEERQWLYLRCPKCGYEWALWKLGVRRNDDRK